MVVNTRWGGAGEGREQLGGVGRDEAGEDVRAVFEEGGAQWGGRAQHHGRRVPDELRQPWYAEDQPVAAEMVSLVAR